MMSKDVLRGVATQDPLSVPGRHTVQFKSKLFHLNVADSNSVVAALGTFEGGALTVSFRDDLEHHTLGSAVMVAPGVALTARHVLTDWLKRLAADQAAITCEAPTPEGMLLWQVEKVVVAGEADLAVLLLRLRVKLPTAPLTTVHFSTRIPNVGEQVFLCGFVPELPSQPRSPSIKIDLDMRVSSGMVTDVWPVKRDSVMLPSPSFAVECPAFGGMSGGPVFDSAGYFIGVVTSSYEGDHLALVTHAWPALLLPVNPFWPRVLPPTTLLHMGVKHGVSILKPDAFRMTVVGGSLVLDYQAWS